MSVEPLAPTRLYFRLLGAQVRSEMQYRVSFAAELVGNLVVTALDFAAIAILLTRFRSIGGWSLAEVAFLYGTSSVSFSLAELFAGAFDGFDRWVVRGEFDRLLLRPLPVLYQMVTGAFPVRRLGRFTQGLLALVFALYLLRPGWGLGGWLFLGVTIACGILIFLAIFIAGAAAAFWSPQTGELTNIFTYGGQAMTSYPMHIYQAWMRSVFTFLIPMAFINYLPALRLLHKPGPPGVPSWAAFASAPAAAAALAAALAFWRAGVRRYQSTGS